MAGLNGELLVISALGLKEQEVKTLHAVDMGSQCGYDIMPLEHGARLLP